MQYEYDFLRKTIDLETDASTYEQVINTLNRVGVDGWECFALELSQDESRFQLMSFTSVSSTQWMLTAFLKRPARGDADEAERISLRQAIDEIRTDARDVNKNWETRMWPILRSLERVETFMTPKRRQRTKPTKPAPKKKGKTR